MIAVEPIEDEACAFELTLTRDEAAEFVQHLFSLLQASDFDPFDTYDLRLYFDEQVSTKVNEVS
jgi:hypothetical protein